MATNQFGKAALLLGKNQVINPTLADSIISNYIDGNLYMDTTENAALLGTKSGIYLLAGDSTNTEIHRLLVELFEESKQKHKRFTLFSPSKEWDERISSLLGNKVKSVQRYSFKYTSNPSLVYDQELPLGFKLSKVNPTTIAVSQEFNESYYKEYWGTINNFLENGIGFYIKTGDIIAAECVSIFASPNYAEIDIVTNPNYRGMGLATILAKAFIVECVRKKKTPRWDCAVNNVVSINLAEKLGFDNPTSYSVFIRNS
ncbi:GNAT family N-acetyltransferase [Bacillus salitolerans]|uniref:GNAT family N-acetyltransferase n=1 Tax=Bacillus salitolerans TaxID=1437434 RepID=A0ABW4LVL2_9BACI